MWFYVIKSMMLILVSWCFWFEIWDGGLSCDYGIVIIVKVGIRGMESVVVLRLLC